MNIFPHCLQNSIFKSRLRQTDLKIQSIRPMTHVDGKLRASFFCFAPFCNEKIDFSSYYAHRIVGKG